MAERPVALYAIRRGRSQASPFPGKAALASDRIRFARSHLQATAKSAPICSRTSVDVAHICASSLPFVALPSC
jgi:hypothetical protein